VKVIPAADALAGPQQITGMQGFIEFQPVRPGQLRQAADAGVFAAEGTAKVGSSVKQPVLQLSMLILCRFPAGKC